MIETLLALSPALVALAYVAAYMIRRRRGSRT